MVKHIKKNYAKDGKLTKREKSIAYATAWKHHNEENDLTELKTDTIANYTQGAQISLKKDSSKENVKKRIKGLARAGSQLGKRVWDGKLKEDARYDSSIGGHEWGTPQGTDYLKSLTPGQSNPKEDPIKPLDIKARKPEDEKAVKVTEGALLKQFEPEYSEAKRRVGNKIRGKLGLKKKPVLDWKKDRGINELSTELMGRHARAAIKQTAQMQKLKDNPKTPSSVKKAASNTIQKRSKGLDKTWGAQNEDLDLSSIEPNQADHSKHRYPKDNEKESHDKGDKDHWLTGKDGEWYIEHNDITELDKEAENYTFDKAVKDGLYDEDELEWEDFDNTPGFDNEVDIHEVLSVQGRMKRRFAARRNRQKLKVARRIALRRGSTPDRLKRRATRGARLMVYKRLLRGRDRAGLPPAEKARLETMIKRFQPLVNRVAVKLLPQMRRNEINRMKSRGGQKPQTSKKYKAAKPIRGAASQKAKRYKIKKPGKYQQPKKPKYKSKSRSGGPTLKKASKSYKAFTYSVG